MTKLNVDYLFDKWVTGELSTTAAGSGVTQTVGHDIVAAFTYTGADVSTNLADCTTAAGTISAPGAWTDIVDFDIGEPIKVQMGATSSPTYPIMIKVDSGETVGDAIRLQVLVDGVVVADVTVTKDAADVTAVVYGPVKTDVSSMLYGKTEFNCLSSFKVRATRNGTFANADTKIYIAEAMYFAFQ